MRRFFIFFILLFCPLMVNALPLPVEVTAEAVLLFDMETGEAIYEKNPDMQECMASLTKMITVYTVLQQEDINLNKKVTITEKDIEALWYYTQAGLQVGDVVTIKDLMYGTILQSGADAAQALAIHSFGSTEECVKQMNIEIKKIGLAHSKFVDPYGGGDQNISTPRDMAKFLRIALKNETFKKIFGSNQYTMTNGLGVVNYTRPLAVYYGLDPNLLTGNKSGFTDAAGLLLASTATINGIDYGLIVCNSKPLNIINDGNHIIDSYKVYNYLMDKNYDKRLLFKKDEVIDAISVVDGIQKEYDIKFDEDIYKIMNDKEYEDMSIKYDLVDSINDAYHKGDKLGQINVMVGDEIAYTYNVILNKDLFKDDVVIEFVKKKKNVLYIVIPIVVIGIIGVYFIIRRRKNNM